MLGVIIVDDFSSPPPGTFADDSCRAFTENYTIEYKFTRWQGTGDWSGGGISGVASMISRKKKTRTKFITFPRRNTLFQPPVGP